MKFKPLLLSAIAAILYFLAFPPYGHPFFAFVFLIPLLYANKSLKRRSAFFLFLFSAFLSQIFLLSWIPRVMVHYGGATPFLGIISLAALSLYIALFSGFAGIAIHWIQTRGDRFLILIPLIWILKDLLLEKLFSGFPWELIGYSQHSHIYFLQWASIGGIHFVSFILISLNVYLFLLFQKKRLLLWIPLISLVLVLEGAGWWLLRQSENRIRTFSVKQAGIIQPNVTHDILFTQNQIQFRLERLFKQSESLALKGCDFIIWPEFTVPLYPKQDFQARERFLNFASEKIPIVAGFTDYQDSNHIFNSAMIFDQHGIHQYNKVHLTPFGEYIPFRRLLFFVKKITDEIGDFTPGSDLSPVRINTRLCATPICYEIIYPELVNRLITKGGELIITISNDSWFGDTFAPHQHLSMAVFRAVETRRYLLRSTSNGISASISPAGRVMQKIPYNTEGIIAAPYSFSSHLSIFSRFGYLFPYFCIIALILVLIGKSLQNFAFKKKAQ